MTGAVGAFDAPALRPGTLAGHLPERRDPQRGWVESLVLQGTGLWHRRFWKPGYGPFVAAVAAAGTRLEHCSQAELRACRDALRPRLVAGLTDRADLAEAFALVGELCHRLLGMRPYPVQIQAGWAMFNGQLVEMATGEGKTLAASLPAATAALAGVPVHVVTVNDYLVARDAEQLRPVYEALGLSVGTVLEGDPPEARRAAYACDLTYCSNKQLAFDYLKDRLTLGESFGELRLQSERWHSPTPRLDSLLMRGLCFAIVDEADSVLVDEARTPLIISRAGAPSSRVQMYEQALEIAAALQADLHYRKRTGERALSLTAAGRAAVAATAEPLGGLWKARVRREELVAQALAAQHEFIRDRHYLLKDGKVQIIDEYTGRLMPDRSWERGLHQLIEVKEGVEVTGERETLARISYQRFFSRYLRLAGMSGTVREVAPELWRVYGLRVVRVPTHRPEQRRHTGLFLHADAARRWDAVVEEIAAVHAQGRPVLVGTRSVEASETLSAALTRAGIRHEVLNARQDAAEAEIVRAAGAAGAVTVATNMAGRGTDIKLDGEVRSRGGLHVIAAERNEAARIDRQLVGRCGRQGDPGSYSEHAALDDELFSTFASAGLRRMVERLCSAGPLTGRRAALFVGHTQRRAERRLAHARALLAGMDQRLGDALAFSGRQE
jgi:preprotein translocase subunit SecA